MTHDDEINVIIQDKIEKELREEIPTKYEKISDFVAHFGGSWRFIGFFTCFFLSWIVFNVLIYTFDAYPFIALNLCVSLLAIYQAPFILMSQNRKAEIDNRREIRAYKIAIKAEIEIKELHEKVDKLMKHQKIKA